MPRTDTIAVGALVMGALAAFAAVGILSLTLMKYLLLVWGGVHLTYGQVIMLGLVAGLASRVPASLVGGVLTVMMGEESWTPKLVDFAVGLVLWVIVVAWWAEITWGAALKVGAVASAVAVAVTFGVGYALRGLK